MSNLVRRVSIHQRLLHVEQEIVKVALTPGDAAEQAGIVAALTMQRRALCDELAARPVAPTVRA